VGTPVAKSIKTSGSRYNSCAGANGSKKLDEKVFERQAAICKAFANPVRLRLLDLLGNRDFIAGELQQELGISKANLSQHLNVLRSAGVIVTNRQGKQVICSLAIPEIKQACALLHNVLRAQVRAQVKEAKELVG
jgi:DNA-binding transcriptional ArsR family regulator